jgi:amino acid permease
MIIRHVLLLLVISLMAVNFTARNRSVKRFSSYLVNVAIIAITTIVGPGNTLNAVRRLWRILRKR